MNWIDAALLAALLLGLVAGGFMVARSPVFWIGLAKEVVRGMLPIMLKRMTPEQEQAWRDCERRGGKWNHQKKQCEKWR